MIWGRLFVMSLHVVVNDYVDYIYPILGYPIPGIGGNS